MTTPVITISAFRDDVPITLDQVLDVLGDIGRSAVWRLARVDVAPGGPANHLQAAADRGADLSGEQLFALAEGAQVIEGEFEARRAETAEPWLVLRAVDGTWWDIVSDDVGVLRDYKRMFPEAARLP